MSEESTGAGHAHPGRLLVVDDEVELLAALTEMLDLLGYEVVGCADGEEALRRLQEGSFDLLLTDLMMPDINGIDLLRRALEIDPHLIGILMTGQATVQTAVEAMKVGAVDYVTKPFKMATLAPVLARGMELRRLRTQNVQLREMVAVYELGQTVSRSLDLPTLLERIVHGTREICEADEVSVLLPASQGDELYVAAAFGEGRDGLLGQRVPVDKTISGWVARHREQLVLRGEVNDPRFEPLRSRPEIETAVSLPLLAGGKFMGALLAGVLNVNVTQRRRPLTVGQRKALTTLGTIAAAALDRTFLFEQLRASESRFRNLIENSSDVITVLGGDGTVIYQGPSVEHVLGYRAEEMVNRNAFEFIHPDDAPRVREVLLRDLDKPGNTASAEYRFRHRNGSWRTLESIGRNLLPDPAVAGIVVNSRDITERKQAEDALWESNTRLQQALDDLRQAQEQIVEQERLRALGEMASGIAHDFNNALSPIVGYTDLLLDHPGALDQPETARSYLEAVRTAAGDAAAVVARLRTFYRSRGDEEVFTAVDLNRVAEQAISLARPRWKDQAQAAGRTIHVEAELGEAPAVTGDEAQLREALMNLIFNAVDALSDSGTITVRTYAEAGMGCVEVADTGCGMPEAVRQRCLEPFFTTKGQEGTGLGLPMVYGIIQRHNGTLRISSEPGQGTTVGLCLPASTGNRQETPRPIREQATRRVRVLVVDDEAMVRNVTAACLRADGHEVDTAESGEGALRQLAGGAYDLVITDQAMPGMSGEQLARAIKSEAAALPVILLTGFGVLLADEETLPSGVDAVLAKPVTASDLRETVARLLPDSFVGR